MEKDIKITVYTQTYNAGKYLNECIESILNQTYGNFEYIIADHGSTDSTWDVIEEYSAKDKRIRPIRFDHSAEWLIKGLRHEFVGKYYTVLDQDDWIESCYLERLLEIAEKYDADIVNTGSILFNDKNPNIEMKYISDPLYLNKDKYARYFPAYHWFYRQYWGKLVKTDLLRKIYMPDWKELKLEYGNDTFTSFSLLRGSNRIYVDNSIMHHYRIHNNSQTRKYSENQSYSNEFLHNLSVEFLSQYGEISKENLIFIYCVYTAAVGDTLRVLLKSEMSEKEKLKEIYTILNRDVTSELISFVRDKKNVTNFDDEEYFLETLISDAAEIADTLFQYLIKNWSDDVLEYSDVKNMFSKYFGEVSDILCKENFSFWIENDKLRKDLIMENYTELICGIAEMISNKSNTKKYDLEAMIKVLTQNDNVLCLINDKMFIRKHLDIYCLVAKKEYSDALEKMTGIITEGGSKTTETFLNFYITLAALLEKPDEFINGKFILSKYYLQHKCYDECRTAVNDLVEMGCGDEDAVKEIKKELDSIK